MKKIFDFTVLAVCAKPWWFLKRNGDAGLVGNYNLGPDAANRFASGKEVVSNSGQRVKLIPLSTSS